MAEWLYSEEAGMLINTDRIDDIFIERNAYKLIAVINSQKYSIGKYGNKEQCEFALHVIMNSTGRNSGCITVPSAEEMERRTRTKDHERAANGKKTVRRGGS